MEFNSLCKEKTKLQITHRYEKMSRGMLQKAVIRLLLVSRKDIFLKRHNSELVPHLPEQQELKYEVMKGLDVVTPKRLKISGL